MNSDMRPHPDFTIVVPVYNEEENVEDLAAEIVQAMGDRAYEVLFVNDASRDATAERLTALKATIPQLRVLSHRNNVGQSRAVRTGVQAARAPLVATLDGDGQNDPADAPLLLEALSAGSDDLGMVGGRRAKRRDTAWKRFGSRFANGLRKRLLKDRADDTGCGLKAFRRDAFLALPYFDHMHRFLPALMLRDGWEIDFRDVNHRPRQHGSSKYTNFGRLANSVTDLMGVMWLNSRARRLNGVEEF